MAIGERRASFRSNPVRPGSSNARGSMELIDEARRLDPDRALGLAFATPADRPLLAALVLFNAELARIPEVVREPLAGMIRYQWWRDAIGRAARGQDTGAHPLLAPLAAGLAAGRVEAAALEALVEAREAELERLQPADLPALEAYADATSGALHRLLARAVAADPPTVAAAGRVGTGVALVGIVRAIGFHQLQGRLMLPAELVEREAVDPTDILAARNAEALGRVTGAILERAQAHLEAAAAAGPFARRTMPALLTARLARRHVRRLIRQGSMGAAGPGRDVWTVPDLAWHYLVCRL